MCHVIYRSSLMRLTSIRAGRGRSNTPLVRGLLA